MSQTDSIKARYESALKQTPIPSRIQLPNTHFVSNVLPGRTNSTSRRLKQLQQIYTANEFPHFTKNFKNRQLNLRTGFPVADGRGVSEDKKKKKTRKKQQKKKTTTKSKKHQRENNVVRLVKSLLSQLDSQSKTKTKQKKRQRKK